MNESGIRSSLGNISSSGIDFPTYRKDKYASLSSPVKSNEDLKKGIWIYFLLVIFEGALRKWFLPGLATPLLVIRDPIAIWLILLCWKRGLLPSNIYMSGIVFVGIAGIFTAIFLGHKNLAVAVFGARILLFHFPLIFIIGRIFDRKDVITVGKVIVYISIPMTILVALQFYSPQSAWVNRGVGGDLSGGGFNAGGMGYLRPPATFSFTTGTVEFYSIVSCYITYFWFDSKGLNKLVLIMATLSLLAIIPLSISRALFFQIIISLIFAIIAALKKKQYISKIFVAAISFVAAIFLLSFTSFFNTAVDAFTERFVSANEVEGGIKGVLGDRFLGGLLSALTSSADLPFFGYGLGMGTNVGSMLLTGETLFLISEGEWGRVIGELGPIMGLMIIFFRVKLTLKIALACYRKLLLGDILPWMLLSYGVLILPEGNWSRPTSLGFCIIVGGLMIASLRVQKKQVF